MFPDSTRRVLGFLAAAILVIPATAHQASAVTAVSNLTLGPPEPNGFVNFSPLAVSFTTGAAPAVLNSVTLQVSNALSTSTNTFAAAVWSDDSAGHPGVPLESYPGHFTNTPTALVTYPSASGLHLEPNTTYWVVMTILPGGNAGAWYGTGSHAELSNYGWTIGDKLMWYSPDSWGQLRTGTPDVCRFSIDATILPEPTSLLAACGLALLPLRRRPRMPAPRHP